MEKSVKHNLNQIDCCLHFWRGGLVIFNWCLLIILQWSLNDGLWPDAGPCTSSPLEGRVLRTWQNWPLQTRFPQKCRVEMPCHSLSCAILSLPATAVGLLFVHQRVALPDRRGRGCYIHGGVRQWNTSRWTLSPQVCSGQAITWHWPFPRGRTCCACLQGLASLTAAYIWQS